HAGSIRGGVSGELSPPTPAKKAKGQQAFACVLYLADEALVEADVPSHSNNWLCEIDCKNFPGEGCDESRLVGINGVSVQFLDRLATSGESVLEVSEAQVIDDFLEVPLHAAVRVEENDVAHVAVAGQRLVGGNHLSSRQLRPNNKPVITCQLQKFHMMFKPGKDGEFSDETKHLMRAQHDEWRCETLDESITYFLIGGRHRNKKLFENRSFPNVGPGYILDLRNVDVIHPTDDEFRHFIRFKRSSKVNFTPDEDEDEDGRRLTKKSIVTGSTRSEMVVFRVFDSNGEGSGMQDADHYEDMMNAVSDQFNACSGNQFQIELTEQHLDLDLSFDEFGVYDPMDTNGYKVHENGIIDIKLDNTWASYTSQSSWESNFVSRRITVAGLLSISIDA
ncbi:MAG: hypothetical protein SGILL_010662, partial [Bacillariaceae sp.]